MKETTLVMNAVIDIGNTQTKIGLFEKGSELLVSNIESKNIGIFLKKQAIINALVSNVSHKDNFLEDVKNNVGHMSVFTINTSIPIFTTYKTPKSLGVDRLAACVGARKYASGNVLVIDAGSCITLDLLTQENEHVGGIISPGVNMRLKAMHNFTANLPLVSFEEAALIGKTTQTCLQSGATNGALAEIQGLILAFQKKFKDLSIIIGGGDAEFFDKNLELSTFVVSNLVVVGLHTIYKYNE